MVVRMLVFMVSGGGGFECLKLCLCDFVSCRLFGIGFVMRRCLCICVESNGACALRKWISLSFRGCWVLCFETIK